MGFEVTLVIVCSRFSWIERDEESKEVFSNLVTLSKKLEPELQDDFIGISHCATWKNWFNEDLMELGVQRKDEKRQEEITKELERFTK